MNPPPLPHMFIDPNERLLASVIPPPPLPLKTRVWRHLARIGHAETRRLSRWLYSREAWQRWLFAAVASAALVLGLHQSGASSATGDAGNSATRDALRTASLALATACPPDSRVLPPRAVVPAPMPRDAVAATTPDPAEEAATQGRAARGSTSSARAPVEPAVARHAPRAAKRAGKPEHGATKSRAHRRSSKATARRQKAKSSGNSPGRRRASLSKRAAQRARAAAL